MFYSTEPNGHQHQTRHPRASALRDAPQRLRDRSHDQLHHSRRRLLAGSSLPRTAPGTHPRDSPRTCRQLGELTPKPHQQQPARATPSALRLLSRLPSGSQPGCQPKRDDQPLSPSQTMIHRYEKQLHDACMALFVVGLIGTAWHVALAELAKQPTQHSGTQIHKVVAQ